MASYKDANYLVRSDSAEFDKEHNPGVAAPHSGIYRCCKCGYEVASNEQQPLPTQNHATHPASMGAIKWRLVVFAQHKN